MRTGTPQDITRLLTYGYQVRIGEYISRGWDLLQSKLGIFVGYVAVLLGINIALLFFAFFVPSVSSIVSIVSIAISPALNAGLFIVAHKLLLGESVEFGDFFKGFEKFGVFLLAGLVSNLFIFLGTLLCIIPGIYLGTAYSFVQLFIIDRDLDFWPAMEMSRQLVTRNFFPVFLFSLLLGLINFGGSLLCGLGLLITIPLTHCATAVAYMDIMNQGRGAEGSTFGSSYN